MAILTRYQEWCRAVVQSLIDQCSGIDQYTNDYDMAVPTRYREWCRAVGVSLIDQCSVIDQQSNKIDITVPTRRPEWSLAIIVVITIHHLHIFMMRSAHSFALSQNRPPRSKATDDRDERVEGCFVRRGTCEMTKKEVKEETGGPRA